MGIIDGNSDRSELRGEENNDFAEVRDFVALLKPRVMSLVVFTALVGMVSASGHLHPVLGLASLICIAAGAGAAGALNMAYDADIDAKMLRTRARPIPAGRIAPEEALSFGLTLSIISVFSLGLFANWLAAFLLAFTIFFYAIVYTLWLKRRTVQNIVIGGAAGALPPIIGAAAMSGRITLDSLLLFLIIFLWTPPHFWALALYKSEDYARANVPMLPAVKGGDATRRQILLYSILYVAATLLPWVMGTADFIYAFVACVTGILFLICAFRVYRLRQEVLAETAARQLFAFSILQLLLLFAALLAQTIFMG